MKDRLIKPRPVIVSPTQVFDRVQYAPNYEAWLQPSMEAATRKVGPRMPTQSNKQYNGDMSWDLN